MRFRSIFLKCNFLLLVVITSYTNLFSQTTFYDLNSIQKIEIFFSIPDWDYRMDTAKYGADSYLIADSVLINGVAFDSAGVKYKGNSSYDSTQIKNPLHIELDNVLNQSYQGVSDIKLGNGYADPSMIREVLSYDMLQNYMHCPRANFAQVYINGNYIGLYSNAENIGKDFVSTHFNSSSNSFFKCNPITVPTPLTKSNLRYINTDSSSYFNYYELKSTTGWNDLVKLCDTVTNFSSSLGNVLDMDRVIWMLAFNNVLVNLDSYTGVFCQNYYLYKDNTAHFNPIIWDLNMALGGFPYVGSGASSMGSLTVVNMQQLPATIHSTDVYWPLIKNTLSNPMYKRMYIAHMRTILNEMFVSGTYQTLATQIQATIDTAVQSDSHKFFTYSQFQNAMSTDNVVGTYTVPGISNLMSARISYLQGTADFTATPPSISNVLASNTSPALNSVVTITAQVTGSTVVYLGYRTDLNGKFVRVNMYDDGTHNDGAAGDNVFGADFTMSSAQAQYYIYGENASAGMFSPQRAEHEFYTLVSNVQTAGPGQVAINEFLAVNQTGQTNELGNYEDWIELYNTTSNPLELFGLYLTDDITNLTKYTFPINTVIQPNDHMIIWADDGVSTAFYLHCNFKLSGNGEKVILSNSSGTIIDSISFGPQTADVSIGRCPDGTGAFATLVSPSFDMQNCTVGIEELESGTVQIYPNPANSSFTISRSLEGENAKIDVINATGSLVYSTQMPGTYLKVDASNWPNGIYFVRINNTSVQKIVINR